jgi:hypothetical protein
MWLLHCTTGFNTTITLLRPVETVRLQLERLGIVMDAVLCVHAFDRFVSFLFRVCQMWLRRAVLSGVGIQIHQEIHMQEDDE